MKIVEAFRKVVWSLSPGRLPKEYNLTDAVAKKFHMANLDGILNTERMEVESQISLLDGSTAIVRHFAAGLAKRQHVTQHREARNFDYDLVGQVRKRWLGYVYHGGVMRRWQYEEAYSQCFSCKYVRFCLLKRPSLLCLADKQLPRQVAKVCEQYPRVDLPWYSERKRHAGSQHQLARLVPRDNLAIAICCNV